ncbi:MAG TPA: glycosyltransferase family 4 protein [Microvirga sp.]|jgi:glycosyltransferase involved in cell wall biosynthesis|nr:glycosyltransferase family 4 protein [Microvirga sp.]
MARFTLDLWKAAAEQDEVVAWLSISAQNSLFPRYHEVNNERLLPFDTFSSVAGPILALPRLVRARKLLLAKLRAEGVNTLVNLMPHVWTPLLLPAVRAAGVSTATIIHDARPHPGDPTGYVNKWCNSEAAHCDRVFTLSETIRDEIVGLGRIPPERCVTLFHPDIGPHAASTAPIAPQSFDGERALRLLFFGRILPYKGLGLLVEALEKLRAEGVLVQLGVFGDGSIAQYRKRLEALGAEISNRWIEESELESILRRWDAVALSHVEASQSGVAALAFGSGLPVIATPVGGLAEQVVDGVNGVLASRATADAFAAAIRRYIEGSNLRSQIRREMQQDRTRHSMASFIKALCSNLPKSKRAGVCHCSS